MPKNTNGHRGHLLNIIQDLGPTTGGSITTNLGGGAVTDKSMGNDQDIAGAGGGTSPA